MNQPLTNAEIAELDLLVDRVLEQTLSPLDARRLNLLLSQSPEALRRYQQTLDTHLALCELFPSGIFEETLRLEAQKAASVTPSSTGGARQQPTAWSRIAQSVAVLSIVGLVGFVSYQIGRNSPPTNAATGTQRSQAIQSVDAAATVPTENLQPEVGFPRQEATLTGHGILRQSVDVVWPAGQPPRRAGSLLQPGELSFDAGVAVLDFFSGATLVVAGPARLEIVSDWAVTVHQGRLEATVPLTARGFVIKAADTEIIDLGTRFALEVSSNKAQVAVLDGEIMLRGNGFSDNRLLTGDQAAIGSEPLEPDFVSAIPRLTETDNRGVTEIRKRFEQAVQLVKGLADDPRLIACYSALEDSHARRLANLAITGLASDAQLIGPVEIVPGRFPNLSNGLNFGRPGSRGRVNIAGSFTAYTFACWTKIDSLRHTYNALFLADGYENGEPHWQIRHDGRLMFSVMVDDSREVSYPRGPHRPPLRDAGFHRVYFSEPFWDASMNGRWLHLAVVYDPTARQVTQYLDGREVCREEIPDEYFIADLRIGAAEIGNWGQPFRKTPDFAVRNLDGVIDEMIIFNAALPAAEIHNLYQRGSPQ